MCLRRDAPGRAAFLISRYYRLVQAYRANFLQSLMSTPFLRDKTMKFCTSVSCAPVEPFTNGDFFFPPDVWVLVFLGDILGLKGSHISSEKTHKTHSHRARQRHIEYVCKFQGLSQKRRGHSDFCAVKCQNHGFAS